MLDIHLIFIKTRTRIAWSENKYSNNSATRPEIIKTDKTYFGIVLCSGWGLQKFASSELMLKQREINCFIGHTTTTLSHRFTCLLMNLNAIHTHTVQITTRNHNIAISIRKIFVENNKIRYNKHYKEKYKINIIKKNINPWLNCSSYDVTYSLDSCITIEIIMNFQKSQDANIWKTFLVCKW